MQIKKNVSLLVEILTIACIIIYGSLTKEQSILDSAASKICCMEQLDLGFMQLSCMTLCTQGTQMVLYVFANCPAHHEHFWLYYW